MGKVAIFALPKAASVPLITKILVPIMLLALYPISIKNDYLTLLGPQNIRRFADPFEV